MISINGKKVEMTRFPDGTRGMFDLSPYNYNAADGFTPFFTYNILWKYESDEEYIELWYIVNHLRESNRTIRVFNLVVPYFPNARMDRVKSENEIFTLKYFSDFINKLNFNAVYVLDPHSDVMMGTINNVHRLSVDQYVREAIHSIYSKELHYEYKKEDFVIYFPDAGAMKRYKDLDVLRQNEKIYGNKVRNWETGKIEGLEVLDKNGKLIEKGYAIDAETGGLDGTSDVFSTEILPLKDKVVIMIDDIISYGGTLAYSADKLKELGASHIFAYASHIENSIDDEEKGTLLKRIQNGTVEKVYTTDSLYSGSNEKIVQFKILFT